MKRKYLYAILLSASLVGSASPLQGQNKAYNYVHSTVMLDKDGASHLETVQYYNAFGSPVRNVKRGFTPIGKDLLTHEDRDVLNKPHYNWLPLPSERKDELMPDYDYARLAKEFYNDANPYVRTVYENSPLERVREQYGEGELWQNAGRGIKAKYLSNTKNGILDCRRYVLKDNGGDRFTLTHSGAYAAATLQVKETANEDGNKTYEFTDTQGRLLLSRQMDGDTPHDTYLLYTLSGETQAVLPPALTDQTTAAKTYGMDELRKYAYLYRYDRRDRLTEKWIPGSTASVRNVYDQAGRPVLTQDANLRGKSQWSITKYDVHGRSILTGILTTSTSFEELTESIGSLTATESYTGNRATDSYGYTQNLNPGNISIQSVTYYDDYHFLELDTDFVPYTRDAVSGEYYAIPKGKVTGEIIFALEDATRAKHITHYYNNRGSEIQSNSHDSQGFTDRNYTKYDFTGHPLSVKHTHTGMGNASVQELYTYTYDHGQRLTQVKHKLNNEPEVILTANEYDEACRLKRTTMNNAQLVTEFAYNIRNWVTKITNPKFTQALHYTDGLSAPCYNGNISSMTWRSNDLTDRGYKFTYDGLSRLKDALYGEGSNLATNPNRFNEQVTGYDKQGNILSLKRSGQTASNAYGLIDNLSLSYDGNQLKAVNDNAVSSAYGNSFEFKDGEKQAVEYSYDANGNLTQDLNKKITDIQYNCLNLPRRIQFANGNSISYLYAANGTKLRTTHVINGVTATTDYCGSAIYENGVLTKLLTEQGYVTLADKIYHYFIQDHQGNNRVVVSQNGTVEETSQYYPFGGVFASSPSVQPYKYNGKELDRKGGLDWCDYGARHYDAAIGRWNAIDLMAENFYSNSSYGFCKNNPINRIDIGGKWDIVVHVYNNRNDFGYGFLKLKNKSGEIIYSTTVRVEGTPGRKNNFNNRDRTRTNADTPTGRYKVRGWSKRLSNLNKESYGPNEVLELDYISGEAEGLRNGMHLHGGRQNGKGGKGKGARLVNTLGCLRIYDEDIVTVKWITDLLEMNDPEEKGDFLDVIGDLKRVDNGPEPRPWDYPREKSEQDEDVWSLMNKYLRMNPNIKVYYSK